MKIRSNYVSNSSSSSFVCDICGNEQSGWDLTLHEAEMIECENGHIICKSHQIEFEPTKEDIKNYFIRNDIKPESWRNDDINKELEKFLSDINDENLDYNLITELYYEYTDEEGGDGGEDMNHCPICMFKEISENDIYRYIFKKYDITKEGLLKEIREEFKTYDKFKEYIKGKSK